MAVHAPSNGALWWLLPALALASHVGADELSLLQVSASRKNMSAATGPGIPRTHKHHRRSEKGFSDFMDAVDWLTKSGLNPSIEPAKVTVEELDALRAKASPLLAGKRVAVVGGSRGAQFFCFFKSIMNPENQDSCNMLGFWNEQFVTEKFEDVEISYMFAPTVYNSTVLACQGCSYRQPSVAVADHGGYSAYDIVIFVGGTWDMIEFSEGAGGWGGRCQKVNHTEFEFALKSELSIMSSGPSLVVIVGPSFINVWEERLAFSSKTMASVASEYDIAFVETFSGTKVGQSHSADSGHHYDEVLDKPFVEEILEHIR